MLWKAEMLMVDAGTRTRDEGVVAETGAATYYGSGIRPQYSGHCTGML